MRFVTRLISALVGFVFTLGGFGKASAEKVKVAKNGTVIVAKQRVTPSMSSADELRKQLTVLAATKGPPTRPTKGTKPTKTRTRSPKKPTKGKGK